MLSTFVLRDVNYFCKSKGDDRGGAANTSKRTEEAVKVNTFVAVGPIIAARNRLIGTDWLFVFDIFSRLFPQSRLLSPKHVFTLQQKTQKACVHVIYRCNWLKDL